MPAAVPGDLVTDLQAAGLVGDPLYELNFLNASLWSAHEWTLTTTFAAPAAPAAAAAAHWDWDSLLVFDGVKMGSRIVLDGKEIGNTTDQFLRYVFPVTHAIGTGTAAAPTRHKLEVTSILPGNASCCLILLGGTFCRILLYLLLPCSLSM